MFLNMHRYNWLIRLVDWLKTFFLPRENVSYCGTPLYLNSVIWLFDCSVCNYNERKRKSFNLHIIHFNLWLGISFILLLIFVLFLMWVFHKTGSVVSHWCSSSNIKAITFILEYSGAKPCSSIIRLEVSHTI